MEANSLQRPPQGSILDLGEADQAQLLAARHNLGEAGGKGAAGFEDPVTVHGVDKP